MKFPLLLLAATATALHAAGATLPEFNSSTIAPPPLLLGEAAKLPPKPFSFGSNLPSLENLAKGSLLPPQPSLSRLVSTPPRFTPKIAPGKMPVLEPNPGIDYKIVLKAPDPSVDFKMLIQPRNATGQKSAK